MERVRAVVARSGGGQNVTMNIPSIITLNQTLFFTPSMGRASQPMPANMPMRQTAGGQGTFQFRQPFTELTFIDFGNHKYINCLKANFGEDTLNYYVTDKPFADSLVLEAGKKTKKILGYECKQATVRWKDSKYTVWYTEDLEFTYSPMPQIVPESGVVLMIDSEEEKYMAKEIVLEEIDIAEVMLPNPLKPVALEEYNDIKRNTMQQMRQQFQNNPGNGPGTFMFRN